MMKCPKCETENQDGAKFCRSCGNPLEQKVVKHSNVLSSNDNTKTIIITLIAIAIIVLIGVGVYASGVFTPDVPLNTQDFGAFKADVPVGSKFVVKDAATNNPKTIGMSYENKGKYRDELTFIIIGNVKPDINATEVKLVETDGNMKVYQYLEPDSTGICCFADVDEGDCQFEAIGYDLDTVKRVAKSFKNIELENVKASFYEDGYFILAAGTTEWGKSGKNGGIVTIDAVNLEATNTEVGVDEISKVNGL